MIVLAAAVLTASQATGEPARPRLPYSIEFDRTQIGPWQIEATSRVEDETGVPMRASLSCEIRRAGMQLRTWREGQLEVRFGGDFLAGDQLDLGVASEEVRRIELDDSAWEYRWLSRWRKDREFVDVGYPPPPPKYPPGWDIIHYPIQDVLQGIPAVRRGPGSPWFDPEVLGNALLRAKRLRIGYVGEDRDPLPDEGPLRWAEFSLEGLSDAFAWCGAAMDGEKARLFHADLDP
ncbi:MAG: hypothetical protein ABWX67_07655 [Allosphingosinicella sp.]